MPDCGCDAICHKDSVSILPPPQVTRHSRPSVPTFHPIYTSAKRFIPPNKLLLILQDPAQMSFQEAFPADPLLPVLGSPSLCLSPDGTGWRPLPDWEPPESRENLCERSIAGHREDIGHACWVEGGQKEADLMRAQREGGDLSVTGWAGVRRAKGERHQTRGEPGELAGWAGPLPLPCFVYLPSTYRNLPGYTFYKSLH